MVAAGEQQARRSRSAPISGALSGVPGRRPAAHLDQLELGDLGQRPVGLAEQLVDAARGDPQVEAALLDGRPDDDLAARPAGTT